MAEKSEKVGSETYWDRYGIPRTTLHRAMKYIERAMVTRQKRGVITLISEAGVGKTQAIHQLARKHDYRVVDIRTANYALMGAGVPQRADANDMFKIAVPEFLPKPGEKCILLFDEVNQGLAHAIAMFVPLIEDRCLFNYKLSDETLIVALMNPARQGYQVSKLESNIMLNRRLTKYFVHTPFSEWEKYAKTDDFHYSDGFAKPCHTWITRYLNTNRSALYDGAAADKGQQFPCPATWQTASFSMYMLEKEQVPLFEDEALEILSATIGHVAAKGLVAYIRDNEVRIAPEEILEKYKPSSKLRKRVQDLTKEAGGGVPDLTENVAAYIFDHKPAPDSVATCLALFWADLPEELAQGFYSQLGAASQAGDEASKKENITNMMALTKALMGEESYLEVNTRLHKAHDNFELALKGGKAGKDPLTK